MMVGLSVGVKVGCYGFKVHVVGSKYMLKGKLKGGGGNFPGGCNLELFSADVIALTCYLMRSRRR